MKAKLKVLSVLSMVILSVSFTGLGGCAALTGTPSAQNQALIQDAATASTNLNAAIQGIQQDLAQVRAQQNAANVAGSDSVTQTANLGNQINKIGGFVDKVAAIAPKVDSLVQAANIATQQGQSPLQTGLTVAGQVATWLPSPYDKIAGIAILGLGGLATWLIPKLVKAKKAADYHETAATDLAAVVAKQPASDFKTDLGVEAKAHLAAASNSPVPVPA